MNAKISEPLNPIIQARTHIGLIGVQGTGKGTRYFLNGERTTRAAISRKWAEYYRKG
jgi:hypothetical protein